jgi:hypothetical protein
MDRFKFMAHGYLVLTYGQKIYSVYIYTLKCFTRGMMVIQSKFKLRVQIELESIRFRC